MKIIIILASLIAVHAGIVPEECNGVTIGGVYHDKELLHQGSANPYLLAIDYSTNNLYFTYESAGEDEDSIIFKSARLNLDTKEFKNIEGVHGPLAQTVDQSNHVVYIGGNDGIYKYNASTNNAHIFGAEDTHIYSLYYKDVLYYAAYPSQYFYTLVNGESTRFAELDETTVEYFVIDNNDVMFFANDTGIYTQKKGTKDAVLIKDISLMIASALAADKNGDIYVCLQDGVYVVKKDQVAIEKVVAVDAHGVAFDRDNNMVYSYGDKLVRLLPNTSNKC